ncbi:hypothetical protein N7497_003824 [Penicillium chrysogenum]|nr:hypothetical protein N7497_003824 [Penicillium chrysogenum]
MGFKTIALFGATGQVGRHILHAILDCKKQSFHVVQIVSPSDKDAAYQTSHTELKVLDLFALEENELCAALRGVDVVISALNGQGLEAQPDIQDAAASAGVKRFYPSEYGMHHIYRKPGDSQGYIHPLWNVKDVFNEKALHHPAIKKGQMTYTLIGCGDFYDQEREKVWCPWTQTNVEKYTLHIVNRPDAEADFTNLRDFGNFVVETLCAPETSENATLNVVSDHISYNEIAALLGKYFQRPVERKVISENEMHNFVANPSTIPQELSVESAAVLAPPRTGP